MAQVEFCFTGEGSDAAPAPVSLRGLDAAVYYRSGSLLNCGHAAVSTLACSAIAASAAQETVGGIWGVQDCDRRVGGAECMQSQAELHVEVMRLLFCCAGARPDPGLAAALGVGVRRRRLLLRQRRDHGPGCAKRLHPLASN